MALFNKNKQTTIAELEEYYAGQKTSRRTGMAWVMAFLSLLITVSIIVCLFFAGRWLYRTLTDTNEPVRTDISTGVNDVELPSFDGSLPARPSTNESSASNSEPTPERDGVVSDEAASTTTSTDITAGTSTVGSLPNTGAGESIILVMSLATVVGYFIARKKQLS